MKITALYISIIILLPIINLFKNERARLPLIYIQLATLSYFFLLIVKFYGFKFNWEFQYLYPDESTYMNEEIEIAGMFGVYVQFISKYLPTEVIPIINILLHISAIKFLFKRFKHIGNFAAISFILVIGSYWSIFILKESLTFYSLTILLTKDRWHHVITGLTLLTIARPEFTIIYCFVEIIIFIFKRSRYIFTIIISLVSVSFYQFFDHPFINAIKLFSLSRRYGEANKILDSNTKESALLELIPYVKSTEFKELVFHNLNNCFNIFQAEGFVKLLCLLNLIGLGFVIYNIRNLMKYKPLYSFLTILIILTFTHNNYRYMNTLILSFVPFLILYNEQDSYTARL